MPLATFEPFNRLPLEVRRMIWRASLKPRLVSVVWKPHLSKCVTLEIPSILHVSREAREEGLQMYVQTHSAQKSETNSNIFFNYDVDTTLISYTNYGPSFQEGLKHSKTSMFEHHRLVRFVSINWLNINFEPSIAITDTASPFPLLEEFSIAACNEAGPRTEKTIEIVNTSIGGQERMPKLKCLANGYICNAHWWFKAWNECQPREVESWGKAFYWINQRTRRRYYNSPRLGHLTERDQIGLPLDIADIHGPTSNSMYCL